MPGLPLRRDAPYPRRRMVVCARSDLDIAEPTGVIDDAELLNEPVQGPSSYFLRVRQCRALEVLRRASCGANEP